MRTIDAARAATRRTLAITGGGLLLVLAGCSGESSQDTENPPATSEAEAGGTDDGAASSDDASSAPDAGEESGPVPDEEAATTAPQPPSGVAGPAPYAEGEDPCAEVAAEDLAEAVGSPLRGQSDITGDVAQQLEDSEGDYVHCFYPQDGDSDPGVALVWRRVDVDFPDEMPEDIQAEHERSLHVNYATGQDGVEEVALPGVPEAYASVDNGLGHTFVNLYVPFDDALLVVSLLGPEGTLDESDIPRAVQAAEVAMARP